MIANSLLKMMILALDTNEVNDDNTHIRICLLKLCCCLMSEASS